MRIEVFVDGEPEPRQRLAPPASFELDTTGLADGPHLLRIRAVDDSGSVGIEEIPFTVRNGPGIALIGLAEGETVRGKVSLLVNAFAARHGDVFEPVRAETPAPIPTWAWVLVLVIGSLGMYDGAAETTLHRELLAGIAPGAGLAAADTAAASGGAPSWAVLGEQVFGNNCSPCHQLSGAGVPSVFPPLAGDPVVTAHDPTDHIRIVLDGLSATPIAGVAYASPMPPFGAMLNDEEVAAVINHERTSWGNQAPTVTAAQVAALRGGAAPGDSAGKTPPAR